MKRDLEDSNIIRLPTQKMLECVRPWGASCNKRDRHGALTEDRIGLRCRSFELLRGFLLFKWVYLAGMIVKHKWIH